jgi:hypothetical protein
MEQPSETRPREQSERFFQVCSAVDEIDLLDLLLHRYHNIEYVLQTDADTGLALILKAMEKDRDERLFQQWTAQLPLMGMSGVYESFAAYKDRMTGANIDRRSVAEIEADIEEAERQLQRGGD